MYDMAMGTLLIRNHCQFVRPYKDVLVLQLSIRDCTLAVSKSVDLFYFFFSPRKCSLLCITYLVKLRKIGRTGTKYKERNKDISTRKNTVVDLEYLSLELILT